MTAFPNTLPAPSMESDAELIDNSIKSDEVNGMQQTRPQYTRQLRKWTVVWNVMKATDVNTLLSFYAQQGGGSLPFTWTDPDSATTKNVRFDTNLSYRQISYSRTLGKLYRVSFGLREV